mmetsp:Transcript_105962/g.203847  ORF Transcript_105962/g.203847 Transcript_105962/m.203847 type:complete len:791 (-) Transcript_105962:52-2424(-)
MESMQSMLGIGFEEEQVSESVLLYNSVRGNEQHLVNGCLDRGADINYICFEEPVNVRTPLRAACSQANIWIIRCLLGRGATVYAHFGQDRWSALHSAAHAGHDHVVRMMLVEVEDLHENHLHDGFSLLHILAECASPRLLNGGADLFLWALRHMPSIEIDFRSRRSGYEDWTPLHLACARGLSKVTVVLLRAHAEVHARTGSFHVRSPFVNSIANGDGNRGAQVANTDRGYDQVGVQWLDKGLLPIHLAAFGGHLRVVQHLVRCGQAVNATTERHRWTPLMFGAWNGNVELVREVCRIGGREVVNYTDRRADGSEWTPLAMAVSRWGPDMVQALVEYGADPLVRLGTADFPGQALLRHVAPMLMDAADNCWSGPDSRVSLLHLAVLRGDLKMLRTILPLIRAAHFSPVHAAAMRPALAGAIPWQDAAVPSSRTGSSRHAPAVSARAKPRARGSPLPQNSQREDAVTQSIAEALESSRVVQDRARERLRKAPVMEGQDCDPVAFCSVEGWSPAVLAILLHVVDPVRQVPIEYLQDFPDPNAQANTRADIFLELLNTGRSLLEDRPDASPPVLPQRFHDVSESLVSRVVDEFHRLCKASGMERVAFRITHATLCIACRFNRLIVVKHLLQSGLCDPRCRFLKPVECRPLHIATACGFGFLAQMLLEYKADPLESDENAELPVYKLTRYYVRQVSDLQARVAELEARLREVGSEPVKSEGAAAPAVCTGPVLSPAAVEAIEVSSGHATTPASSPRVRPTHPYLRVQGTEDAPWQGHSYLSMARFDSVLHDSRM